MPQLVLASSLKGLPIASIQDNAKVGAVKSALIDTKSGNILGMVANQGLFTPPNFIAFNDIKSISRDGLVVQSKDDIVAISDVVKAKEVYDKGFPIIGLKVKTKSGKRLGRVTDLALSLEMGCIAQFYVSAFLSERIINRTKVINITKKGVTVEDDTLPLPGLPKLSTN